jgi:hypothetical protein
MPRHGGRKGASIAVSGWKTKLIFERDTESVRPIGRLRYIDSRGGEFLCLGQIGYGPRARRDAH